MNGEFVPYRLRMPLSDDLHELRDELSLQRELHGRRSIEAQVAFENLFRTSVRIGRPLDRLRQFSTDEVERFFAQTRNGPEGHVYWLGGKVFRRNDGKQRRPVRWWYEHLHGPISPYEDVVQNCGQSSCINPDHAIIGRDVKRRRFSDEQMIGTLQVAAMQLGHPPTTTEFTNNRYTPTVGVYKLRFGSWLKAIAAAGLGEDFQTGYRARQATPERARASLREARRFLGHIPGYDEYRSPVLREHLRELGLLTSQTSVKRQIGPSWQDAIRNTFQ